MGLRVKPSSADKKSYTKSDAQASKAAASVPSRGSDGRMASNKGKGSVKSNSRPRTLGALKRRAGGTNAGGR